jgi:hypothetical protein
MGSLRDIHKQRDRSQRVDIGVAKSPCESVDSCLNYEPSCEYTNGKKGYVECERYRWKRPPGAMGPQG